MPDAPDTRNASSAVPLTPGDEGSAPFWADPDARPPMPEPPPVRLLAVADVVLQAPAGVERAMDELYIGLLKFEREDGPPESKVVEARPAVEPVLGGDAPRVPPARGVRPWPPLRAGAMRGPVYRAERHRLCVEVHEPPIARDDLRPVGVEVSSLPEVVAELDRREVEYTRQRGIVPGADSVLFQDPAGNWLEVSGMRPV